MSWRADALEAVLKAVREARGDLDGTARTVLGEVRSLRADLKNLADQVAVLADATRAVLAAPRAGCGCKCSEPGKDDGPGTPEGEETPPPRVPVAGIAALKPAAPAPRPPRGKK